MGNAKKKSNDVFAILSRLFVNLAARLDARALLGFRLWRFSLLNMRRGFSRYFLFRVMMRHPLAALRGVIEYRRRAAATRGGSLPTASPARVRALLRKCGKGRFIIAPGYCLKPYDYEKGRCTCPAGHFNHDCVLLKKTLLLFQPEKWPPPCHDCGIAPLAQTAAKIGADFYIMTSAMDIARDIYLPALCGGGARHGLFFLCPYSVEPFTFGLLASGMSGELVAFCRGDCKNHVDWTNADLGRKADQTFVEEKLFYKIRKELERFPPSACSTNEANYTASGHVYRARTSEIATAVD